MFAGRNDEAAVGDAHSVNVGIVPRAAHLANLDAAIGLSDVQHDSALRHELLYTKARDVVAVGHFRIEQRGAAQFAQHGTQA